MTLSRPLLAFAAGAALAPLQTAATRAVLERRLRALKAGDPRPLLSGYAEDATLAFPGSSSWSRVYRGRDEIEGFLRRFLAAGLTGDIEEVVVQGPPWRTTVVVQFNDHARDADGSVVYENRAILFVRARWGRIVEEEVYEDTERATALDAYLEAVGLPAAAGRQPVAA